MTSKSTNQPPNGQSRNTSPDSRVAQRRSEIIDTLRSHNGIEKVVTYDDDIHLDGVMVILDWVTDSTNENGTRIIHEKEYNGEIRTVSAFLDELAGVRKTRGRKTGIARYTMHLEYTGGAAQ